MELWPWLLALIAACIVAWRSIRRRGRARRLMLLCHRAGLEFSPIDPFADTLWLPFRWLGDGRWTRAENVVWSRAEGHDVRAFDLLIEENTDQGARSTIRRYVCAAVALPFGSPRLEIVPRDAIGHVAGSLAASDVELELEEFNRRYRLLAEDRRFAVAFCDQRMMRALMGLPPGVSVAVNEDRMLLLASDLQPAEVLLLFEAARAMRRSAPTVVADLYPQRLVRGQHEDRWLQGHWSPEPTGDDRGRTTATETSS